MPKPNLPATEEFALLIKEERPLMRFVLASLIYTFRASASRVCEAYSHADDLLEEFERDVEKRRLDGEGHDD